MTYRTRIEALIGRELEREQRAGVDHFVPGQHAARPLELAAGEQPRDLYELTYVSSNGHGWYVLVDYAAGDWQPVYGFTGGQTFVREQLVGEISDRSRGILEKAHTDAHADIRTGT